MARISKRYKQLQTLVTPGKAYSLDEALKLIQSNSKTKFVESVDVAVRLGVDAKGRQIGQLHADFAVVPAQNPQRGGLLAQANLNLAPARLAAKPRAHESQHVLADE